MINENVGIIGYGSMGSMLLQGFIDSNIINPYNLYVSSRTNDKIKSLENKAINICSSNKDLVSRCNIIFICLVPLDIKALLEEIQEMLTEDKHVVSSAGSLSIRNIEMHKGKVSRVIPTFISLIQEGISLISHNVYVLENDKKLLGDLLSSISTVKEIPENEFELVSDLTSCAPGLFAEIFKQYVNSAQKYTSLNENEIAYFVIKTLYGTSRLLNEVDPVFDNMIKRVATKGGSTEVGVQVLSNELPRVFDEMFGKTIERQNNRKIRIDEQFID